MEKKRIRIDLFVHSVLFSQFLYESFIPPSCLVLPSPSPRRSLAFSLRIPFLQLVSVSPCKQQRGDTKGPEGRTWLHCGSAGTATAAFLIYFFLAEDLRSSQTANSNEMKLLWGHAALSEVSVPINVINRSQWWLGTGERRLIKSRTKAWLCRALSDWSEEMDDWRQSEAMWARQKYIKMFEIRHRRQWRLVQFLFSCVSFFSSLICKVLMGLSGSLFALVHIFDKSPLSPTS